MLKYRAAREWHFAVINGPGSFLHGWRSCHGAAARCYNLPALLLRVILAVNITIDFLLSDVRRHNEEGREFGLPRRGGGNKS